MSGVIPGISAVLTAPLREEAVLDLVAVLDGLVGDNFDITVAAPAQTAVATLQASHPNLPIRQTDEDLTHVIGTTQRDLILLASGAGDLDVYELNHFLDSIEHGADLAVGYRSRTLERVAWNAFGALLFGRTARDVDCPFKLFRRAVWERTSMEPHGVDRWFSMRLIVRARRLGFRVAELPVRAAQGPFTRANEIGSPETEQASRVA
jgi:hypothetical protein